MASICNFKFSSTMVLDGEEEKTEFIAKGYKDFSDEGVIYYFKHENSYKFYIKNEVLTVNVNDSVYVFDKSKKTEAIINNAGYSYKASVKTNELMISEEKIVLEYVMDFVNFKGIYKIILELL